MRWLSRRGTLAATHLLPADCFVCSRRLVRHHLGACPSCWSALVPLGGSCCVRCAIPLGPAGSPRGLCLRCAIRPFPLDEAMAAVAYRGVAARFLLRAKQGARPELLEPLAHQLLVAASDSGILARADVIVPVPSSFLSRVRRGFSPGHEIARTLARASSLSWRPHGLRRRGSVPAFKALGASERWKRAEGAIGARGRFTDADVLLVDDVMTTGATLAACARALRRAGAATVRAAVWARTPVPEERFDPGPEGRL